MILKCCDFLRAVVLCGALGSAALALPPNYFFQPPVNLGAPINSSFDESSPEISVDGLTLVFSSTRPGGQGDRDLWISTRPNLTSPWGDPVNLGPNVNTTANDSGAALSPDGLTILLQTNRDTAPSLVYDIWQTRRSAIGQPWSAATNAGAPVNSSQSDHGPAFLPDGLGILFGSDRPGGLGGDDIYGAIRASSDGPWTGAANLGSIVNSSGFDAAPSVAFDGLTMFYSSSRSGSVGLNDVWMASRTNASLAWEHVESLGPAVNDAGGDETPSATADGRTVYFRAIRGTGQDIWVTRAEEALAYSRLRNPAVGDTVFASAGDELGFTTNVINDNTAAGTKELGVVLGSGGAMFRMRTIHAATTFDAVNLTNYDGVEFSIDVRNAATTWEAGDFFRVELHNGSQNLVVAERSGTAALDAIEGPWRNYRALVPDDWTSAQLVITSFSNSGVGDEIFDFDNVAFVGTYVIPEPSTLLLGVGAVVTFWLARRRSAILRQRV
jgi:Tol biopolymer transport system component